MLSLSRLDRDVQYTVALLPVFCVQLRYIDNLTASPSDRYNSPMRVMLCQLDGKLPNIALMRIATHHRRLGDEVEMRFGAAFEVGLFDSSPDIVYGSCLFRKTIPLAERLRLSYPTAIIGGTGVDPARKGEIVTLSPVISREITSTAAYGVTTGESASDFDYSFYPTYSASIGFTQRGCRLACEFCCVRAKEGAVAQVNSVYDIWRGNGFPRHLHLLDNDFFGQPNWRDRIAEIRDGEFKVSFNQGINARFLTDEAAEACASVDYRDDQMLTKRIYTAWDNLKDEQRLFDGLNRLVKYGVKPDHIMVYFVCGFWPGETSEDREYRRKRLRDFGARPYPMPFVRTKELVGLQRFCLRAYDKNWTWAQFKAADYRPEKLGEL